jgi:hypothetical protein
LGSGLIGPVADGVTVGPELLEGGAAVAIDTQPAHNASAVRTVFVAIVGLLECIPWKAKVSFYVCP